jgi:peptide/nickel transport system substrate-binding protein
VDKLSYEQLEQLVRSGQISRRDLLKRVGLLGISVPVAASLLAACGDDDDDDDDVPAQPGTTPAPADDDDDDDDDTDVETPEPDDDDDDDDEDDDDDDDDTAAPDDDRRGGSITIVYSPTIIELDVHARNVGTLNEVSHYYYEPLVDRDENLEIHGLLAREMQVSDDGLTHTFLLQENVTFHDGAPFNADVVVWNVNRKIDNQLVLYDLLPLDEVRAVDEYTVEIVLTRPSPGVYGLLATRPWSMYNPEWVDSVPIETLSEEVNGTGPFRMVEYVPNEIMRLERNDDYWQEGLPYLDEVVFRVVPDINTRATMLETGEAQIALALTMQDIDRFAQTPGGPKVLEGEGSLQYYIPMNMVRFPTDELEVRQAINHAIDKEGIIQSVFLGRYATVATAVYLPPIMEGHSEAGVYEYDPDLARQMLEDAGWVENGDGIREKDGEPLSVVFLTRRGQVTGDFEIAELIQAMLLEVGVDCQVELQESATFLDAATVPSDEATYNLLNLTVRTVTLDAEYTMLTFYSCDSRAPRYFNRAYLCDEQVDEWIEQSFAAPTLEERNAIYVDIIRRVHELAPIIQLFDSIETVAVAENLEGVYYDPAHVNWPAKYAWLS